MFIYFCLVVFCAFFFWGGGGEGGLGFFSSKYSEKITSLKISNIIPYLYFRMNL